MRSPGSSPRPPAWRWSAWPPPSGRRNGSSSITVPMSCWRICRWVTAARWTSSGGSGDRGWTRASSSSPASATPSRPSRRCRTARWATCSRRNRPPTCSSPFARWRAAVLTSRRKSPRSCPHAPAGGRSMRARRSHGPGGVVASRARDLSARGRRIRHRRDRAPALHQPEDGRIPPNEHQPQARRPDDRRSGPIRGGPRHLACAASARRPRGAGRRDRDLNMATGSRVPGFYRLSVAERRRELIAREALSEDDVRILDGGGLDAETADQVVENVIGIYGLAFGLGLNFRVNDRDFLVPMAVEEPSVIAAASNAAAHGADRGRLRRRRRRRGDDRADRGAGRRRPRRRARAPRGGDGGAAGAGASRPSRAWSTAAAGRARWRCGRCPGA